MRPVKTIALASFIALVVYSLLVARWSGVRAGYRDVFLSVGQSAFGAFGSDGLVIFKRGRDGGPDSAELLLGKRGVEVGRPILVDTGRVGLVPTALMIALVVATPLRWRNRIRSLAIALVLVNVFIVARVWLLLLYTFTNEAVIRLYDLPAWFARLLAGLTEFVSVAPACSFLVPFLIWVAVALHPEDISSALGFRSCLDEAEANGQVAAPTVRK